MPRDKNTRKKQRFIQNDRDGPDQPVMLWCKKNGCKKADCTNGKGNGIYDAAPVVNRIDKRHNHAVNPEQIIHSSTDNAEFPVVFHDLMIDFLQVSTERIVE